MLGFKSKDTKNVLVRKFEELSSKNMCKKYFESIINYFPDY